jgi:hypothetical protein
LKLIYGPRESRNKNDRLEADYGLSLAGANGAVGTGPSMVSMTPFF